MVNYVRAASADELAPGDGMIAEVDGEEIALFNVDGKFFAIDNLCPHAGGRLGEGELDGTTVSCPFHGSEFDLTSGACMKPPAYSDVTVYNVTVEGSEIQIAI